MLMTAPAKWNHDALAADLAGHLRHGGERLTWLNISLGGLNSARPDVFSMRQFSYARPEFISYEIKVSESDLRSDLTSGKWQKYLEFSQGVTFAVPQGLFGIKDIPRECGIIIRGEKAWRHTRKPVLKAAELPTDAAIKLISAPPAHDRAAPQSESENNRYHADQYRKQLYTEARRQVGERLGKEVATYLRDPETAHRIIENAERKARQIESKAEAIRRESFRAWTELATAIGADQAEDRYAISAHLHRLCRQIAGNDLHRDLDQLRKNLDAVLTLHDLGERPIEVTP